MPKALHDALARAGRKKGYKGKRLDAFVYGAMTNTMKKGKKELQEKLLLNLVNLSEQITGLNLSF